ncbi:MAG: hypothetical protein H5T74_03730 [Actinobacteria bacterium]|nr:hypothetical protein [Actinomycetota bacterium]
MGHGVKARVRLVAVGLLLAVGVFLIAWFHHVEKSDVVFTHFLYLPVVLASLWWGYRGLGAAAAICLVLLVSRLLGTLEVSLWLDLARSASLLLVGTVVAALSERRGRLEEGLVRQSRELEARVEERTRELRERNRDLEAYSYTISHDLLAPLVVIEGFAELLLERKGEELGEEGKEYAERILKAVERMRRLTSSLLEYARAGRAEGETEAVNPGDAARELLAEREMELRRLGAEVLVREGLPAVMVDPVKLSQVLSNLLDNALKYAHQDRAPRIEIGGEAGEDEALVFVRDNGVGIEAGDLPEVFEPFKRFHGGEEIGLGIGLATVKRAVEAWGGRVWAESVPEEGSTFYFTAPLAAGIGERGAARQDSNA